MELFKVNGELYRENADESKRFVINQGGTSSGKTYTIVQLLVARSMQHPRCIITVAGQDLPNLKVGAKRDLANIIAGCPDLQRWFTENKADNTFRGANGALIEFKSYKDAQDAKNGKRDYLFINEANGVGYDVFWQLQIRTRRQVFLDYNPTARFWAHDKVIGRADAKLVISDHRNNRFLTADEHAKIEGIEDAELWSVYARGLTGKLTGLVLTRWDVVDSLPPREEWKVSRYGLDFGFTNDPSALEHVVLAHGELWVDEIIYETGLTNPDIAARCKSEGIGRGDIIVADCAEPKSIRELENAGLSVIPSPKGADSIKTGIDILRRYPLHVMRRSAGLIENLQKYKYIVKRDGTTTNTPIDKFNHGVDAIRYVALNALGVERRGRAKAHVIY